MASGIKRLEKRGFTFYPDSQFYIFERRELGTELFDQIKIKIDSLTVKCSSYIFSQDGYKEEPMLLDKYLMVSVLSVLNELKKEKNKNEKH